MKALANESNCHDRQENRQQHVSQEFFRRPIASTDDEVRGYNDGFDLREPQKGIEFRPVDHAYDPHDQQGRNDDSQEEVQEIRELHGRDHTAAGETKNRAKLGATHCLAQFQLAGSGNPL